MGAGTFFTVAEGKTAQEAFRAAQDEARYESGHGGYTGTIAEKRSFVLLDFGHEAAVALVRARSDKGAPAGAGDELAKDLVGPRKVYALAGALIDVGDPRIDDKWGPAGALALGDGKWLFFGWASS